MEHPGREDEDPRAAPGAALTPSSGDSARAPAPYGPRPLRLPGWTLTEATDEQQRRPGCAPPNGIREGRDERSWLPSDGTHDAGRGAALPSGLHRAPAGSRRARSE